jgi:ribosomal protein S18 acetylase RimI-like enzyme
MPVCYRDDHDVDLDQLATLFVTVGWQDRAADRARLHAMLEGSRFVVSAWDGPLLVGFARAISDGVFNAYLSTVAVLPEYRRRGIASALLRMLLEGKDGLTFALHARREIHPLYVGCGFQPNPDMLRRLRKQ